MNQRDRIMEMLGVKGIKQKDLVGKLGKDQPSVSRSLNKTPLPEEHVKVLCGLLEMDASEFLQSIDKGALDVEVELLKRDNEYLRDKVEQQAREIKKSDRVAELERLTRIKVEEEFEQYRKKHPEKN